MREALIDIQLDIPFSTVGTVLVAGGDEVPMSLGRNCVGQSRALAKKLDEIGCSNQFISLPRDKGIHYAVVARDHDAYLLDPSCLHKEPVNLTRLFNDRVTQVIDAFPIVKGAPAKLFFDSTTETRFSLRKFVFDDRVYKERFVYEFDMGTLSNTLPADDDPYIASKDKKGLTMRLFEENGFTTSLTHRFDLRIRLIRRSSDQGIVEAAFPHYDGNFSHHPHFEHVADRLSMTTDELVIYFDRASRVFSYVKLLAA